MGVGLRFRNQEVPEGDRVEVFIRPETVPKMRKLLSIVGGRVLLEEHEKGCVHMILEKTSPPESSNATDMR